MCSSDLWATEVAVYFLHQQSDALRINGLSTALLYGGVALAGVAALLFARDLEPVPDEEIVEIAAQREAALRQTLARAGVDTLELSTGDNLVQAILRFTDMRKRRSRVNAGAKLPAHLKLVA